MEATLDSLDIPGKKVRPERLIGNKGYDSNKARQLIEGRGMLPIIPARKNNTKATHQDGRHMKRPQSLDYRTHQCVAAKFQKIGRTL